MFTSRLSRRDWLRLSAAGALGSCVSGWFADLVQAAAFPARPKKSCILLWMSGGPSQLDTFDLKPGHANGGPFKPTATSCSGIQISEHLPKIARFMEHMAIIRSMHSKEGDHGRATYLLRTGYLPQGPIRYPSIGALVSKELGEERSELPNFVSIAPFGVLNDGAYGSGFLGPNHAPLVVGQRAPAPGQEAGSALRVENMTPSALVGRDHTAARIDLLRQMQSDFLARYTDAPALSHQSAYDRAVRLMQTPAGKAFDLDEETASVRDAYGRNL